LQARRWESVSFRTLGETEWRRKATTLEQQDASGQLRQVACSRHRGFGVGCSRGAGNAARAAPSASPEPVRMLAFAPLQVVIWQVSVEACRATGTGAYGASSGFGRHPGAGRQPRSHWLDPTVLLRQQGQTVMSLAAKCRNCGTGLLVGARFCTACGTLTATRCSRCNGAIDATALYCPHCGVTVASVATLPDAERRQLTVLFCDLVGSTPLAARLDPEEMRDVIRA